MNEILKAIADNPNAMEENLILANDLILSLQESVAAAQETNTALESANNELKQTNQRLFMRVSSPIAETVQQEEPVDPWEKAVEDAGFDPNKLLKVELTGGN